MATLLLDFDSTLIRCESLETLFELQVQNQNQNQNQNQTKKSSEKTVGTDPMIFSTLGTLLNDVKKITQAGMEGKISFSESLKLRLKLISPTPQAIQIFTKTPENYLTPGVKKFINTLQTKYKNIDIWIISGGLVEVIKPFAAYLNIPEKNIRGITGIFKKNNFQPDLSNPFFHSKVEGCRSLAAQWKSPTISIGDGITDYALYENHLADYFFPYTEHIERSFVKAKNLTPVPNMTDLANALHPILSR